MEKERKTIKCSYAVLVIILFAVLAFVVDYAIIERKMNKCNCPKCEVITSNGEINDNTDNTQVTEKQYNYEDVAGVYKEQINMDEESCSYTLVLSNDGLFRYSYGCGWGMTHYGNYYINNNKIILNDVFQTGSDPTVVIQNNKYELIINENNSITDNVSFAKESTKVESINFFISDVNDYDLRDDYQYLLQDKVVSLMKATAEQCNNN